MSKILKNGVMQESDGTLLLVRCPKCGRENYAPNVVLGICTWCGFNARELLKK